MDMEYIKAMNQIRYISVVELYHYLKNQKNGFQEEKQNINQKEIQKRKENTGQSTNQNEIYRRNQSIKHNRMSVIIDIRERNQYEHEHIRNAIHVPFYNIENNLCYFPKENHIIIYCERGNLSIQAAKILSEKGYKVWTLAGGIIQYKKYENIMVKKMEQ